MLTQFNSASLNRHIAQTYRMDLFSGGFVEVLAAEQTPEGEQWFQGTADAVRQAARHFRDVDAEYYLILAGDHIYRMDFAELIESHIERDADITIAAQPVAPDDATADGHLPVRRQRADRRLRGEADARSARRRCDRARRAHSPAGLLTPDQPFLASMGIYVFSRDVLYDVLDSNRAVDFGARDHPAGARDASRAPVLYRGFWADVGTVQSFYDVNLMLTRARRAVQLLPSAPADLHATRAFCRPRACTTASIDEALVAEGAYLDTCEVTQQRRRRPHVDPSAAPR